jgi:hypothetical protein
MTFYIPEAVTALFVILLLLGYLYAAIRTGYHMLDRIETGSLLLDSLIVATVSCLWPVYWVLKGIKLGWTAL